MISAPVFAGAVAVSSFPMMLRTELQLLSDRVENRTNSVVSRTGMRFIVCFVLTFRIAISIA